jgi:hypothetical protein
VVSIPIFQYTLPERYRAGSNVSRRVLSPDRTVLDTPAMPPKLRLDPEARSTGAEVKKFAAAFASPARIDRVFPCND